MMDFTKFIDAHKAYLKIIAHRSRKAPHHPYIRKVNYDKSYDKLASIIDADPVEVSVVFANLLNNTQLLEQFKDAFSDMFTIGKILEEDALRKLSLHIKDIEKENAENMAGYNKRLLAFEESNSVVVDAIEPKVVEMRECWIGFVDDLHADFENPEHERIKDVLVQNVKTCTFDDTTETYSFDWEHLKNIHPEHARQLIYAFSR